MKKGLNSHAELQELWGDTYVISPSGAIYCELCGGEVCAESCRCPARLAAEHHTSIETEERMACAEAPQQDPES